MRKIILRKVSQIIIKRAVHQLNLISTGDYRESGSCELIFDIGSKPEYGCVAYHKRRIVGWGMIVDGETHLMVAPEYRNSGLGTKIYHKLNKDNTDCKFCPWDYRSRKFFRKHNAQIHEDYRY